MSYCNGYIKKEDYKIHITCHNCKQDLVEGYGVNSYSGGPFYCGNCGADVTEDLYGKKKPKEN